MSQATNVISGGAGVGGLAVRTALNAALAAIQSGNSGTAYPAYAVYGTPCLRTDVPGTGVGTFYVYDGASWIALFTINTSTHVITLSGALTSAQFDALIGSTRGQIPMRGASAWGALTPGQDGADLRSAGSGADLVWKKRAWAHVTGQGSAAILKSANVTSVTRTATGKFTIVMANAMPDANYRVATGVRYHGSYPAVAIFEDASVGARSTTNIYLSTWSVAGYTDPDAFDFEVFE